VTRGLPPFQALPHPFSQPAETFGKSRASIDSLGTAERIAASATPSRSGPRRPGGTLVLEAPTRSELLAVVERHALDVAYLLAADTTVSTERTPESRTALPSSSRTPRRKASSRPARRTERVCWAVIPPKNCRRP
jgi:hypothetical protein